MGTRGFVGVVVDGVEHITYNGMSSSPDWLGRAVLEDARTLTETHSPARLRDLAARLMCPIPGHDDEIATAPSIREVMATRPGFAAHVAECTAAGLSPRDATLDSNDAEAWRWWLDFESLADMLDRGVYEANPYFPLDSGFCEWGYLLDLDRDNGRDRPPGVLEVYRGFQTQRPVAGRWANRPTPAEEVDDHRAHVAWCVEHDRTPWLPMIAPYKACAPVAVWALDSLPGAESMDDLYQRYRADTLTPLTDTSAS